MKISEYTNEYLQYRRIEQRNSDSSIRTYRYVLLAIIKTIGDIDVADIDKHSILKLKEGIMDKSDDRQSLIISVMINFLRYLKEFQELNVYDCSKITIPRVKRKPPEIFTQNFIDNFIENLPNKTLIDKRFKGLNAMLADTGARIHELLDLPRNLDLENKKTVICGKGGVYRTIYWGNRTIRYMKEYLDARPEWDKSQYLFGTINKGNYGGKWNKGDVNRKFRYWSDKIGVRIHCHKYRASFLSNCLHSGMNLSAVSKAMGHSDIRTSMRYFAPMSDENTEAEFEKYFIHRAEIKAMGNIKT